VRLQVAEDFKNLKKWVAGSEAYVTSQKFGVDRENLPKIPFLRRRFDYYLGLLSRATELSKLVKEGNPGLTELKNIAKGFGYFTDAEDDELFGFKGKYEHLIRSIIAFLGEDFTTSLLSAKKIDISLFENEKEIFITNLLTRRSLESTEIGQKFLQFYVDGDPEFWKLIETVFPVDCSDVVSLDPEDYLFTLFSSAFLYKVALSNTRTLLDKHIPKELIDTYLKNIIDNNPEFLYLFPSQEQAIKQGILTQFGVVSLQTPTSSGKTALCELVIFQRALNFKSKTLFLVPFRALATELKHGMGARLKKLGLSVEVMYGGNFKDEDDRTDFADVDLLIITPEKFGAIMQFDNSIIENFELIICDEGHLLESEGRGLNYELILTRFKDLGIEKRKIIYASAIIPNIEDVHLWLDGSSENIIKSDYRAAELNFSFLTAQNKRTKGGQNRKVGFTLEVNPTKSMPEKFWIYKFLTGNDYKFKNSTTGNLNTYSLNSAVKLSVLTSLKALNFGKVAIFTTQKSYLRNLVAESVKQSGLLLGVPSAFDKSDNTYMSNLSEFFKEYVGDNFELVESCRLGILYHHGDLPQVVREKVEAAIKKNFASLLICTSTLAEGVNLPVDTLVLHTVRRFNPESEKLEYLTKREVKNIVGRAGRAGFSNQGIVISANPAEFSYLRNVIDDVGIEEIESYFYQIVVAITKHCDKNDISIQDLLKSIDDPGFWKWIDAIDEAIIGAMSEDGTIDKSKIESLYQKTFAFLKSNPDERSKLSELFNIRTDFMNSVEGRALGISASGCNFRMYESFEKLVDMQAVKEIYSDENETFSYYDLFWAIVVESTEFKNGLDSFNERNSLTLTADNIKTFLDSWIDGSNVENSSNSISLTVTQGLRLFSNVINFNIVTLFGKLSSFIDHKLGNEFDLEILTPGYHSLPFFIEFGINEPYQQLIYKMGLNDRLAIHILYKKVMSAWDPGVSISDVKLSLSRNKDSVLSDIAGTLNPVSFSDFKRWINGL
jgi:helicase